MGAVSSVVALIKKGFPEDVAERIAKGSISEERGLEILQKREGTQALRDEATKQRHGDPDTSYRGGHVAPDADYGAPLHDLTQMIPEDIYGPRGMSLYGLGRREVDKEAFDVLSSVRGKPDAEVTMYRAVPNDAPDSILDGDWVTTSEEYARMHGENSLNNEYKILTEPTYARRLQSEGYPYEFGYMENGMSTPGFMGMLGAGGALASILASQDADAGILTAGPRGARDLVNYLPEKKGVLKPKGGAKQIDQSFNQLAKEIRKRQKTHTGPSVAAGPIHEMTNYDDWGGMVRSKDQGNAGPAYKGGLDAFLEELVERHPDLDGPINAYGRDRLVSRKEGYDPRKTYRSGGGQQGNATPGFMALLGAGGAGATAAARGSHPVSQQAGQLWDDLKGTAKGLLDVAEIPARGLQGLGRVGYGMLSGEGFDEAMRQGNDILQGGTEAAARRAGDEVFKRTGSVEMATAAYTAVMTGSPI